MNEFEYPKAILLNSNLKDSSDSQVDYWGLLHKFILSKWYLYLAFSIICIGLAYVYYKNQQPVYAITSKLLIRERERDYGPGADFVKQNINFAAAAEDASNEIEMLTSFALMKAVVEDLGLETRYYWKHKFSEYDAYGNFPIVVDTFKLNPSAESTFKITPLNNYSFRFSQGSKTETQRFGTLFSNQFGVFRINRIGALPISSDSSMYVSFQDTKGLARNYQHNLSVELSDEKNHSSVLILGLRDVVPQRGIDIVNRLVDKFNQLKSEVNTEITLKTLELIDGRLANISAELASAESTVESYKLNNDIIAETTTDLSITLEDVNNLVKEQRKVELQQKMLQAMKSDLQDTSSKFKLIPINPALYDGKIRDLIQPYNDLVMERERFLTKGQTSNPVVQSNNQKLKSLQSSINLAIDHMQDDLNMQQNKLKYHYDQSSNHLRSVPSKERGLSDRVRIQSIKENLYVYLLQKREETALALVSNYANALLFDPPYSSIGPVGPNKIKIFAAAGMGGLAIPFFLILVLELLKNSVQTEEDLKSMLPEKTIMGVINHQKGKKQHSLLSKSQNTLTERFRTLRTNLQFHQREKTKSILVTSSTSDEGKTFVATNLAMSFALAKKKTIVVDFDLRKPSISKYFEGNAEIGLSSFLINQLEVEEVIQTSGDLPNLDYISGGPFIPNVSEQLTEQQLSVLFAYLKSKYDVIIIDSSPIGVVSDGMLLNNYVDNTLFVVRSNFTKKATIAKAREIFEQNKLVNPAIIFNGVKKQNDAYGYSYKDYGYA
ncbi:GumC family protein [Haliscomenobacter hydrossis]|uniref:non-specific protein-tyrosine kinase n=1 Tax=Haliscomenobacter hydrossis (strain ATCC 27775 / DSM 1100 / LMG 10767 / O) TaxID=760192 RepID=F4KR18_HALH1|nr:tyrosine-protein kinase [Haliscomenobacter hydrossis]AEE53256.1 capsular exopolysaccharide family [Haliscomenobacter hydrossis DSM 1100]